jgi:phytanoyl-CoA hydroxylase
MLLPDALDLDLSGPLTHLAVHGWARLGKLLDDAAAEALRSRADDLMLGRVVYDGLFFQRDSLTGRYDDLEFNKGWQGPSLDYRKVEKLERDPLFLSWIENAVFGRIAQALVGPEVSLYRAVLMTKAATGGTALAWHQDGGRFWGLDREPTLQIWTALDDAPVEAGCVEVVPGTHRAGLVTPFGGNVPEAAREAQGAEANALALPARAGEVILLHNHVWHRSGRNTTGRTRRALSVCYMSAETRCTRKKRAPRQFVRLFAPPGQKPAS